VPALPNSSYHYGAPGDNPAALTNSTEPSLCSCAWATYNTLQACAYFQGVDFSSAILSWAAYSTNCSANLSSAPVPWPSELPIPEDTSIPFWAEANPNDWDDGIFNPSIAEQQLAVEGKPDLTEANRNRKSTPTGAIIGGVIGGVVVVALGLRGFYWLRSRLQRWQISTKTGDALVVPAYFCTLDTSNPDLALPKSESSNILDRFPFSQHNGDVMYPTESAGIQRVQRLPPGAAAPVLPNAGAGYIQSSNDLPDLTIRPFIFMPVEHPSDRPQNTSADVSPRAEENPPAYSSALSYASHVMPGPPHASVNENAGVATNEARVLAEEEDNTSRKA